MLGVNMAKQLRYLLLICIAIAMTSCQAPPSPTVRAFGDNKFWVTVEPMIYIIGSTNDRIVVPKGFVTDFASIPSGLWSLGLSPHGQYSRAAVIHDYLYWAQGCTREQSDRLLVLAMKESNVGGFDEFLVYQGVNLGGQGPWDENAKERRDRLPRIIPGNYIRPSDPNMPWPAYRAFLVKAGVKDPPFERSPTYCAYGTQQEFLRRWAIYRGDAQPAVATDSQRQFSSAASCR